MKKYLLVWAILFGLIGFEYYALNFSPQSSQMLKLQKQGFIHKDFEVTSEPGRSLSLWLGWAGLA